MRDVAFSCDDGGSDFLRVAVWSLLEHYAGDEPIRVNVFEGFGGHSAAHKDALAEVVSRFPRATLRYHDVEPYLRPYPDIVRGRENSRWNIFTWTPIFTPQILADAEVRAAELIGEARADAENESADIIRRATEDAAYRLRDAQKEAGIKADAISNHASSRIEAAAKLVAERIVSAG